jgi:Golgi phosphoprotein 3 (GPP34)
MLLSEQLALIAIDPGSGRHGLGIRAELNACLAGLMVAELVVDGFAGGGDRDLVLTGAAPESPTLAAAARVVADKGPRIKAVLSAMDRGLQRQLGTGTWDTAVAGLMAAGLVGPAEGAIRPKHEIVDPAPGEALVTRLQAAARGEGDGDLRTAMLLSMTGPAQLLELVAPDRGERREARQRIDHALDGTDLEAIGKIVRKLITEAQSAAGAGAVTG